MTMHIQIIVPKETPDNYIAKVSIKENGQTEEVILKPGEVSNQICIYDGKTVEGEEISNT